MSRSFLRVILLCSVILLSLPASAGTPSAPKPQSRLVQQETFDQLNDHWLLYAYPFDFNARYDKNETQDYRRFDPRLYGFGFEFKKTELSFEYSSFNSDSSSGSLFIHRDQKEYNFWLRQTVYLAGDFDYFVGAGVGSYDEVITSQLSGISSVQESNWNWSAGLNVGIKYIGIKYLLLSFEGRVLNGQSYDPQNQFGFLFRLGLRI